MIKPKLLTIIHNGKFGTDARMIKVYNDGSTQVLTPHEFVLNMREVFHCIKGIEF